MYTDNIRTMLPILYTKYVRVYLWGKRNQRSLNFLEFSGFRTEKMMRTSASVDKLRNKLVKKMK